MKIVGVDPSLTGTGLCDEFGYTCTVVTDSKTHHRLTKILNAAREVLRGVDLAVLEDLPTHAKSAGLTGQSQGVVRLACELEDVPYVTVPPSALKKFATGNGAADKSDMRMSLYKRLGIDLRDDNQVDAWWLRAMGYQWAGAPVVELPKAHLVTTAKSKVLWPALEALRGAA